jgi:Flp pilus assembly protein CpaB
MDFAENLFSSRRGTILVGIGAAVLAAILLLVYLNRYRASLKTPGEPATVLVAKSLIQKGAPGNIIGAARQFQVGTVPKRELVDGAITDPSTLRGLVAVHDIYPGQQLTAADFAPAAVGSLQTNLEKAQRAIAIPIDTAHGMIGQIQPGDHIDVYVGMNMAATGVAQPIIKLIMSNLLVLRTPEAGAASGTIVLRGRGLQTAELAFASDNAKLWFVLRPASGARPVRPSVITAQRILALKPVK